MGYCTAFPTQEDKDKLNNPVFHIHNGHPPVGDSPVSFSLLLNLVGVAHTDDPKVLWGYITS